MRPDDSFLLQYNDSELRIVSEFLGAWLPFLSTDLCRRCSALLSRRIHSLSPGSKEDSEFGEDDEHKNNCDTHSLGSCKNVTDFSYENLPGLVSDDSSQTGRQQDAVARFTGVKRKTDFICLERIRGKMVNIVEGLELHTGLFSADEQRRIVGAIYDLQKKGRRRELRERTYTAPRKWMRGKGRETIQFGCCYNYATDKNGNPPGILRDEVVDPIPSLFEGIIRRLVRWRVLPASCVPDSCIVNIYEGGDCIPPHIDSHDFLRPFCTISLVSECDIVFGTELKVVGPGEFRGSFRLPSPVGSVLVLSGNGADLAKHCVPAVPTKRISITFRKMDETKRPTRYEPERDPQGLEPSTHDTRGPDGSTRAARRGSERLRSEEPYSLKRRRSMPRGRTGHR